MVAVLLNSKAGKDLGTGAGNDALGAKGLCRLVDSRVFGALFPTGAGGAEREQEQVQAQVDSHSLETSDCFCPNRMNY